MLRAVMNFFAGSCTVQVSAEHAAAALTALQVGRWMHWQMRTETDGIVHWKMRCSDAARYQEACRPTGSEILVEEPRGMPALRRRYAGRWGIPFGVLLFAGIVWLSTSVVWRVEVSGNKKIDAGEIERGLDEFGFGVGSFFGGIDFDELQNSYRCGRGRADHGGPCPERASGGRYKRCRPPGGSPHQRDHDGRRGRTAL